MTDLSSRRPFRGSCCRPALLPVTQPCAQRGGQESNSHRGHRLISNRATVGSEFPLWGVHPRHPHPGTVFLSSAPPQANSSSFVSLTWL